jgi:hypothetical protein
MSKESLRALFVLCGTRAVVRAPICPRNIEKKLFFFKKPPKIS